MRYNMLGHVLLFLGDVPAASTAFERNMSEARDHLHHETYCEDRALISEYCYVCILCADIDICEYYFIFFRHGGEFGYCTNHKFMKIPRDKNLWRKLKYNYMDGKKTIET